MPWHVNGHLDTHQRERDYEVSTYRLGWIGDRSVPTI